MNGENIPAKQIRSEKQLDVSVTLACRNYFINYPLFVKFCLKSRVRFGSLHVFINKNQ